MPKTLQQTVELPAPPETLFDIYLDSRKRSAAINSRAVVSKKVGGKFLAFHGALKGRNLTIVPKRMMVQSWRASGWKKATSILSCSSLSVGLRAAAGLPWSTPTSRTNGAP